MKVKGCVEDRYGQEYNHGVESSSHIILSHAHVSSCVTNVMDSNYKLTSVIGQEDDFTANKWT